MTALQPRKTPIRTRLRQLTTVCCLLAALSSLLALAGGHVIHGALLLLGAVLLVPGTIWGRRRKPHLKLVYSSTPATASTASTRRPRKAA